MHQICLLRHPTTKEQHEGRSCLNGTNNWFGLGCWVCLYSSAADLRSRNLRRPIHSKVRHQTHKIKKMKVFRMPRRRCSPRSPCLNRSRKLPSSRGLRRHHPRRSPHREATSKIQRLPTKPTALTRQHNRRSIFALCRKAGPPKSRTRESGPSPFLHTSIRSWFRLRSKTNPAA
jgi:hypothetical protein